MESAVTRFTRAAFALLTAGGICSTLAQNLPLVPQGQIDLLSTLIGTQPAVRPAQSRHILVFWRCEGFVHGAGIAFGNKTIELAATQTKAFKADFSNDYEALRPQNLATYDAIILNNTTGLKTQEHRFTESALVQFVQSGKGLVVIHAGADNFYLAEQAAEMVGGRFWGHPWGSGGTWTFKLDDPTHPLNRAFGGKGFSVGDEIYQQQSPFYNRAKLHVLVSLNMTDHDTDSASGQRRTDKDNAVSWIRPYGKGRVFYTSFAHDQRAYLNKATLTHILSGIQYATGDLKADDTPAGLSDADLSRIKTATADTVNEVFAYLQDIFAHTYNAQVNNVNKDKISALLNDPTTTPFGKKAVLRTLLAIGAPKDLVPVSACLSIPETRDGAATLLAATPGKAASQAIVKALSEGDAGLRCTLINALAIRKESAAISPYTADKDTSVAESALAALGRIGDETALTTLSKPAVSVLEEPRQTALAACIGTLAANGQTRAAVQAAKRLFNDASTSAPLRAAAAKTLMLADVGFFTAGVKDTCPMVRQTIIRSADDVPVGILVAALESAPAEDKIALMAQLAKRDAASVAAAVSNQLKSSDESVVIEALHALTKIGTSDQVPILFELTLRKDAIGNAAKETLNDLGANGTGKALFALAEKEPAHQAQALAILGERAEAALIPKFAIFLKSQQAETRKEAWKALGKTADDRFFQTLVDWLPLVQNQESNQAEAAIRAAAKNVDPAARSASFISAWAKASRTAKKALAGLMAGYADKAFIAPMTGALSDADKELRETVLRALADWTDMEPYDVLKDSVITQTDAGMKTVALRGSLKLVVANAGLATSARLVELFKIAPDDRGRITVAEALFKNNGLELFTIMQGLFTDVTYGIAAKKTYVALYDAKLKNLADTPAEEIEPKLWKGNASHADGEAKKAFDRDPKTRWSSNHVSTRGMWYTLDLGENRFLSEVDLNAEKSANDTPNGYKVFISQNGKDWSGPVAQGDGNSRSKTIIPLAVQTRYLKFVTTGDRGGNFWSIHEIHVKAGFDQKKVAEIGKIADTVR